MDETKSAKSFLLGDRSTSDIIVQLRNKEGRPEVFHSHSFILKNKSKFFADRISNQNWNTCIEINCSGPDYDHHVELLRRLYIPADSLLDSWGSVHSAVCILQVATALQCEDIINSCIEYLEAVPWEEKEEEDIIKAVSKLGSIATPILARMQPVDLSTTKNVFVSAIRFATSTGGSCPPFVDDLKTSAQEQVEYMLGDDEDTPLVVADDEVKAEIKKGLSKICYSFEMDFSSLLLQSDISSEIAERKMLRSLSDLEWICNILPKMDLMNEFVANWADMSGNIVSISEDQKLDSVIWAVKVKLIEMTAKVLEAVGYGAVIVPAPRRVQLLKTWLPYIRKMKPLLDSISNEQVDFPYKMDEDLCQSIEGAMVSLITVLPSNDQADILADWINSKQVRFPDLSEAFEIWCYRTKSAKRRLGDGSDEAGDATISQ